jgi:hypothetical protein
VSVSHDCSDARHDARANNENPSYTNKGKCRLAPLMIRQNIDTCNLERNNQLPSFGCSQLIILSAVVDGTFNDKAQGVWDCRTFFLQKESILSAILQLDTSAPLDDS